MIDSLETAIKHCEEVAEYMENKEGYAFTDITYAEYASEQRQLAEWLKELKAYREAYEEIKRLPIVWEFGEGVIRCLTIIEDCLEEVKADDSN